MGSVVVIGGGASGMFAAYSSAKNGKNTILIEKNEKLGKKIYITGKGRCNLTTSVATNEFFLSVVSNKKFLFSCLNNFTPQDTYNFFEDNGLPLKVERGNRVFPFSDKASDVTKTLEKQLIKNGVDIRLNTTVLSLDIVDNKIVGVNTDKGYIPCASAIVCTGGVSYPLTGSTGDGIEFAKKVGHNIVPLKSALVGIELLGSDFISLQGLSLKNVKLSAILGNKVIFDDFGEMLFTHFGISGPIVLTCSSKINRLDLNKITIKVDLKPALDNQTLETRLIKEFKLNNMKTLVTVMRSLLPKTLIDCVLNQAKVKGNKNCSEITIEERNKLIFALKNLQFSIKKLRPIEESIITSGGVDVKQINPKTMESKLVSGLYFAGEVLDVDALTGGYNLQIAYSTGYTAGEYAQ